MRQHDKIQTSLEGRYLNGESVGHRNVTIYNIHLQWQAKVYDSRQQLLGAIAALNNVKGRTRVHNVVEWPRISGTTFWP